MMLSYCHCPFVDSWRRTCRQRAVGALCGRRSDLEVPRDTSKRMDLAKRIALWPCVCPLR